MDSMGFAQRSLTNGPYGVTGAMGACSAPMQYSMGLLLVGMKQTFCLISQTPLIPCRPHSSRTYGTVLLRNQWHTQHSAHGYELGPTLTSCSLAAISAWSLIASPADFLDVRLTAYINQPSPSAPSIRIYSSSRFSSV